MQNKTLILTVLFILMLPACTFGFDPEATAPADSVTPSVNVPAGDDGTVTQIIDGDTIDVRVNGREVRIRYIGVNTPERDEVCYSEAKAANRQLVEGQTVRLVRDAEDTDRYGRLLRYLYVGGMNINATLIQQGYAEVVSYPPNTAQYDSLKRLEIEAANANRGCHPTGIFDDGSYTR